MVTVIRWTKGGSTWFTRRRYRALATSLAPIEMRNRWFLWGSMIISRGDRPCKLMRGDNPALSGDVVYILTSKSILDFLSTFWVRTLALKTQPIFSQSCLTVLDKHIIQLCKFNTKSITCSWFTPFRRFSLLEYMGGSTCCLSSLCDRMTTKRRMLKTMVSTHMAKRALETQVDPPAGYFIPSTFPDDIQGSVREGSKNLIYGIRP